MEDTITGFDPTLDQCCVREMEEQARVDKIRTELSQRDPVEKAERMRKNIGLFDLIPKPQFVSIALPPAGNWLEVSSCDMEAFMDSGKFIVCFVGDGKQPNIELHVKNCLEGFQSILLFHRFSSASCRTCVGTDVALPAIKIWNQGKQIAELNCRRLEKETESSLITTLTLLKNQHLTTNDSEDEEEGSEEEVTGRNAFFKCDKEGCHRKFHHLHIPPLSSKFSPNKATYSDEDL